MSEPKKETVRIVLPPRREGQPLASTPRETAMINLPPKPVPAGEAPSAPPAPPVAPSAPPAMPAPPTGLQPPSAPGIPKPPSFPGVPKAPSAPGSSVTAPLAPMRPPSAAGVPKPASVTPSVSKAPGSPTVMLRPPPSASTPSSPVAVSPEAKKETAKVASGIAVKPQATIKLQPPPTRPQPSQVASASFKPTEITPVESTEEEEIPMNWSIAALVTAIIALGIQIYTMTLTS